MRLLEVHPFTDITIMGGEKCKVWDSKGRAYIDLLAGSWSNVLGNNHPKWVKAVQEQVGRLTHSTAIFMSEEINEGLEKLAEILPHELSRATFLNTGSEGVDFALKIARAATGGNYIAAIERGYFGASTYPYAISEAGRTAGYLPAIGEILRLTAPDCKNSPMGCKSGCGEAYPCLGVLEEIAVNNDKSLAAVVYEPVIAGEMLIPPTGYVKRLRELVTQCNTLLIANEVTSGLGRTGKWFGFQHADIVPDILVIGKAIGAGLPVAVVATTEDVEKRCKAQGLRHVQSHQNDPCSGRIASTVISIMQEENLVELVALRGEYMVSELRKLQSEVTCISDVRGRGLMIGIELHKDFADKGAAIVKGLMDEGFILGYKAPIRAFLLFPPYIITTEEIDAFIKAFRQVVLEHCEN